MIHTLPGLPYSFDALEPFIDAQTLQIHYGKHHQTYVDKTNQLIAGTEFENSALEEIIMKASGPLFNNAAQVRNHTFYRESMTDKVDEKDPKYFEQKLNESFGSLDAFKEKFSASAVGNFGSGWTWLVVNKDNKLEIVNTSNAQNPLQNGFKPVLVIDVWEHAYYLKYQNRRPEYVSQWFQLVNWKQVSNRFAS